jgi:hypothetical protein
VSGIPGITTELVRLFAAFSAFTQDRREARKVIEAANARVRSYPPAADIAPVIHITEIILKAA